MGLLQHFFLQNSCLLLLKALKMNQNNEAVSLKSQYRGLESGDIHMAFSQQAIPFTNCVILVFNVKALIIAALNAVAHLSKCS